MSVVKILTFRGELVCILKIHINQSLKMYPKLFASKFLNQCNPVCAYEIFILKTDHLVTELFKQSLTFKAVVKIC